MLIRPFGPPSPARGEGHPALRQPPSVTPCKLSSSPALNSVLVCRLDSTEAFELTMPAMTLEAPETVVGADPSTTVSDVEDPEVGPYFASYAAPKRSASCVTLVGSCSSDTGTSLETAAASASIWEEVVVDPSPKIGCTTSSKFSLPRIP